METGRALFDQLIVTPLQTALNQFLAFVPSILGALLILLIGGTIAKLIERGIVQLLKLITLDKLADQVQLSAMLAKGGIRRKLSELIGAIVYWIIMLAFVMTALNALNLDVAANLLQELINFLPSVVAAVFITIVGIFAAAFVATTIRTAASNSGVPQAHLLGQAVQAIVIIFTIVAALQQLHVRFVGEVFLIILSGLSLGAALAFGLGCRDMAGKWVAGLVDQLQSKRK